MTKTKSIYLALIAVLLSPIAANADPILWDVDIEMTDGGTVSGSFVFDASTGVFSNVSVSAIGGIFPASSASLTSVLTDFSDQFYIDLVPSVADLTGIQDVYLGLASAMTDAGGTIIVNLVQTYNCTNSSCSSYDLLTSANVLVRGTITAVPEPGTLALFGIGLLGLGLTRRKKV